MIRFCSFVTLFVSALISSFFPSQLNQEPVTKSPAGSAEVTVASAITVNDFNMDVRGLAVNL